MCLGHMISEQGIKPDPAEIEAIKKFSIPSARKEKQFLGSTGYYRKMMRNYAKIARPLTTALRKDFHINLNHKKY